MKHTLQISVSKPKNDGIALSQGFGKEKLLRFLFGDKSKLTVIVPATPFRN